MKKGLQNSLLILALQLSVAGCFSGPGFFTQTEGGLSNVEGASETISTSITDGATTGSFDSGSSLTQTMDADADSAISGSSVAIEPGALGVNTDVTLEEGSDISSSIFSALSVDNSVSSTGTAVSLSSSKSMNTKVPMTLNIPSPSGSSLAGIDANLVVLFQRYDANKDETFFGVIPRSKITIKDGVITFKTSKFGIYQSAFLEKEITEEIEQKTEEKIVTAREEEKAETEEEQQLNTSLTKLEITDIETDMLRIEWEFTGEQPEKWFVSMSTEAILITVKTVSLGSWVVRKHLLKWMA